MPHSSKFISVRATFVNHSGEVAPGIGSQVVEFETAEEKGLIFMLKVVVYDSGYGGELFADYLEQELPIVEIIRVIDWRNANPILKNPHKARELAKTALRPYLGRVDLIIIANYLISQTSLRYFKRKFKNQSFLGFNLKKPDTFVERDTLILTTRALTRTLSYWKFYYGLRRHARTITIDDWAEKIDDGELTAEEIKTTLISAMPKEKSCDEPKSSRFKPEELILALSQLSDIKPELRATLGQNLKIYDSFPDTLKRACKLLKIRGGVIRK